MAPGTVPIAGPYTQLQPALVCGVLTQTRLILFLFFLNVLSRCGLRLSLNLEGERGNFGFKQFAGNDHGRGGAMRRSSILNPRTSAERLFRREKFAGTCRAR